MKKIVLILILSLSCMDLFAESNYKIKYFERDRDYNIKFKKLDLVYSFYFSVFQELGLHDLLTLQDKKEIFSKVYSSLIKSYQNKLTFRVKGEELFLMIKPYQIKNNISIVAMCNYDVVKKKIVPADSDYKNFYAKLYYIVNNRLVRSNVYYNSKNDLNVIGKLRKDKDYYHLAHFMLFDVNKENDSMIPELVKTGAAAAKTRSDRILIKGKLLEYYLKEGNFEKFDILIRRLTSETNMLPNRGNRRIISSYLSYLSEIGSIIRYK